MNIATQLKTRGVAEVLVMLEPATAGDTAAAAERVTRRFASSELAHNRQFLRAFATGEPKTRRGITPITARSTSAFRVYSNLGIVYGTVDRVGLSTLRNAPGVKRVVPAPELSLVKPTHREAAAVSGMSLGIRGWEESLRSLVQRLRALGVLPVFAVGNEGPGTSRSPGNYPAALSVGASDRHDFVAHFSSSQRFQRTKDPLVPDLVAPGVDVLSCVPGGFDLMDGTSMATPHVAGLAALLIQAVPKVTVAKLERAIFTSCTRPDSMQKDRAHRGIPNGPEALASLGG